MRPLLLLLSCLSLVQCKPASSAGSSPTPTAGPAVTPSAERKRAPLRELTVDEVAARLGKPGVYVYDNNIRDRWVKGHVPGARWVNPREMTAADLPADKDATLIFYCANEH